MIVFDTKQNIYTLQSLWCDMKFWHVNFDAIRQIKVVVKKLNLQ